MDDFRIEFDNPQGVYFPGQAVSGKVIIQSRDSIKARFLKICIYGGAHTSWSEHEHKHRTDARGRSDSYTEHVNYSATIKYLEGESLAWKSQDGTNKILAGTSIFPFAFSMPPNCPPSFEGFHGSIRYSVHVELDRPWNFNKKSRKCFSVIPNYDLNITPTAINPMVNSASKNTGLLFKKGLVSMTVSLPKRGYVPGEILPITVNIDNGSKKPVVMVRAKMQQLSHFSATRGHTSHPCEPMATGYSHPHNHQKNDEKIVAESRRNIDVAAGTRGQVVLSMKIPAIVPSFQCPIISVDYCISVKIDTQTTFGSTLKCEFPLIIGTIPIRQLAGPAPPAAMPSMMVSPMAPPYPVVPGTSGAPPAYPSAPPPSPGASEPMGTAPEFMGASAPPPSYEESMTGVTKVDDSEPFAPRYPVYNNLEQPPMAPTQQANFQAPPLPQKF